MFRVPSRGAVIALISATFPAFSGPARADDAAAPNDTVIVTASPLAADADRFATIVETVDRDQILKQGGANLADALANVPGVTGSGFAAGASRPVIRGMDAQRVKVLEDGLSSSDVSDIGPDHGVPIDPLAAREIEVVRGAATLRYGSQAVGGVVNAINNRIPTTLPDQPIAAEATAGYGTGADTREGSLLLDAKAGDFAFHADGFLRRADDYGTPLGPEDNSFFRGGGFSLGSSYFFGDASRTGISVTRYDAKYGIPADESYIDMHQTKVMSSSSFALGDGVARTLNVDVGYADYAHDEDAPDGSTISTFKNKEWDSRAELLFGPMGPFSSSALGVQLQNRKFSALGEDSAYLFPTLTRSGAVFLFTELPVTGSLTLQAAGRVETVHVEGTPASDVFTTRNFTPVSGSVGLLFDATDSVKLGLTATSAARAPGQTELFARGAHDGPATYETGDPSLRMERSNSIEGTIRASIGSATVEGSAWAAWFDNYIYGDLTGRTCDDDGDCAPGDGGELKELFYTQHDARFWGMEAKAQVPIVTWAGGSLSATMLADYVRAQFSGDGNVPRIPPYRIGGGLSWTSAKFDAGFTLTGVGRQSKVSAGETPTDGYLSLDAQVAWRPFDAHPAVELAVIGHNLTNQIERNAVSFNKDDVLMPGRDVRFVVRARY